MSDLLAISCDRIFDGARWHEGAALLVEFGYVTGIVARSEVPANARRLVVGEGSIIPGFVDLQVNGGGGVLLNNDPSLAGIRTICSAHARYGTTALLPTLITDTVEVNLAAMAAGEAAHLARVPGFVGLHLEGPHLAVSRKGTHDPDLIRPIDGEDLARLIAARTKVPNLLCTVAAETVSPEQIARLVAAGIVVSLGHSDATYEQAASAFSAGASMVTHLFNAMSQLGNREPGLVGAALDHASVHAGIIADGIHVHRASIGSAIRGKRGPGHIFLVTDSMSQTGTDLRSFVLNGRTVTRAEGALRLADGTLAGADLDMIDAVSFMVEDIGLELDEAIRMASLYPAQAIGLATHGHLETGAAANFVHLTPDRQVNATWIGGVEVFRA